VAEQTESADHAVESFEVRAIAVERLTFFADAVIAIAITLLALDLPVPSGATNRDVLHFVNEHRDEYIAFLISFAVIGAYWRAHHRVFRYVTTLGGRLVRYTMIWLLMQVITPFATRVLTAEGPFQTGFIFYALVQAVASAVFILMLLDLRRHKLTREDTPPAMLRDGALRSAYLAAGFLISIAVSFVSEAAAFACWIVIPILGRSVTDLVRRRGQRGSSQSAARIP
jgi:uncharacterized membrane protein